MSSLLSVCIVVCLPVCKISYSKSFERILMIFWNGASWPKKQSTRFWFRVKSPAEVCAVRVLVIWFLARQLKRK